MTREDIEKAAMLSCTSKDEVLTDFGCNCFIEGAQWRINSVWHDAKEAPKYSGMLIVINKDGKPSICGPNNSDWKIAVKIFNIVKWAYISDLIPDGKEETK